jgi:uncharacterized protein (TIGR00290 family)
VTKKAVFNWSGGKDSALALHLVLQDRSTTVVSLITTLDKETGKSFLHGIPVHKLQEQAKSIGIPLYVIEFSTQDRNYEKQYLSAVEHFKALGVTQFIFGDIHLSQVKTYREKHLNPLGIEVVEPLWDKSSAEVIQQFFESGIQAKIVVTQADKLNETYIGQVLNPSLVESFPIGIDPCGEFGEYHTFAFAGGPFKQSIHYPTERRIKSSYQVNLDNGETTFTDYWQVQVEDNNE